MKFHEASTSCRVNSMSISSVFTVLCIHKSDVSAFVLRVTFFAVHHYSALNYK